MDVKGKPVVKRASAKYRLVVSNEDTLEEVANFKVNRYILYATLCTMFLISILLTAALITFSPLKNYLPGMKTGETVQIKELREMKMRTDSMENALALHKQYLENIGKALTGNVQTNDSARISADAGQKNAPGGSKKSKRKR